MAANNVPPAAYRHAAGLDRAAEMEIEDIHAKHFNSGRSGVC
jgi:hypothetical protein